MAGIRMKYDVNIHYKIENKYVVIEFEDFLYNI